MLRSGSTNLSLVALPWGSIPLGASTLTAVADENGRYQGVPNDSGAGVFVIDTWTGTVKLCYPVQSGQGYVVRCTDFSN